jgi:hypothetical protein
MFEGNSQTEDRGSLTRRQLLLLAAGVGLAPATQAL